jgi:hypothetical protein
VEERLQQIREQEHDAHFEEEEPAGGGDSTGEERGDSLSELPDVDRDTSEAFDQAIEAIGSGSFRSISWPTVDSPAPAPRVAPLPHERDAMRLAAPAAAAVPAWVPAVIAARLMVRTNRPACRRQQGGPCIVNR